MNVLGMLGGVLVLVGWIWAIVDGFRTSGALWGILNIIPIQPLIGIISAAMKKIAWAPVGLMALGVILSWFSGGMAAFGR
jgi:hypothetical protein